MEIRCPSSEVMEKRLSLISKYSPAIFLLFSPLAVEKIVWLIILRSVNCETEMASCFSTVGKLGNSSAFLPIILNTDFSQRMVQFPLSSVSMERLRFSVCGSLLTISWNNFASKATLPGSTISPGHIVSIPNSDLFPVSVIFPSVASRRIHSIILIVVFEATARATICIAETRSFF